ncbi:hypothetical protein HYR54_09145 [Candidatus Acetothermia bacterium]|nr:hypothetical protein [Candidatus Acetothermia bacterium]MBI3460984.1 hypothetical protein [Candidatus Acetothermia bacterium]
MGFFRNFEKYILLPLVGAVFGTLVQMIFYPPHGGSYRVISPVSIASSDPGKSQGPTYSVSDATPTVHQNSSPPSESFSTLQTQPSPADDSFNMGAAIGVVTTTLVLFWVMTNH